jgi:hypothetical protein
MKFVTTRQLSLPILLAAVLLMAGCGQKAKVKISGQVTRDGQPIAVSSTGTVWVTLVPLDPGTPATSQTGRANADGSFEISNVYPGKHRVAVEVQDPSPRVDALRGAFSKKDSPIIKDLDGKTPLNVDIAKPTQ